MRGLEQVRIEAIRQNGADLLAPLLDAQLIYVNARAKSSIRRIYLRGIRTRPPRYDRYLEVLETENQVLGDVIILVGIMLGRAALDGEQVFQFPRIGVWRKDSGHWRMPARSHRRAA